jgi:Met-zincin/Domain of unknown function (DUF5117)
MRNVARGFVYALGFAFTLSASAASAQGQPEKPPATAAPTTTATIASKTAALKKLDGFMPLYWDEKDGKLLMEITQFDTELLYQVSLPAGVGSNPIGLDRGALGDTHVITFQRVGPKVLMVEPNYRYRALTSDPAELRAVKDSFAQSVLWGFTVEASEGSRVLVDATKLILRDAYGVIDQLRDTRQGQYRLDESRSAFYLERTKNFPKNSEIEATLTFVTDASPGPLVRQVTPTAQAVTVRQHHSFIELPKLDANGYKPRKLDPRVGAFGIEFHDYASPITEPIEKRWIVRHRLEKKNPAAAVSEAVKPIVYYVDNGAPEPIRGALVEGASWWARAFEAAGFKNGFQVKVLPADADPMDVRYNVINWVHRSTRGWSYGNSIVDPRTGEILKGHVTLGSLRVRQDYMLGTGMIPTYTGGGSGNGSGGVGGVGGLNGACEAGFIPEVDYLAAAAIDGGGNAEQAAQTGAGAGSTRPNDPSYGMSIQRIRQLSAHEVGHTLGFAHNFAASTYGGRASVMDYPAPLVEIKNGALDLSNAYTNEIGAYDIWSVKFAYSQFAPGGSGAAAAAAADEAARLEAIVQDGVKAGMQYITDTDARPAGAAHPFASLWDNGSDPIAMLKHEMEVRRIGLSKFGLKNVPAGSPLSLLEAKLLPLYLHHRYQLQAAVKSVGGASYSYAVRAANGPSPSQVQQIVPAATQRAAIDAVLATITPEALDLPDEIIALIPPKAFGFGSVNTELFEGRTDPVFDPLGAASIAADMAISGLLQHQRAARMNAFHLQNAENPAFSDVLDALGKIVWAAPATSPRHKALQRTVQHVIVQRLMDLASHEAADPQVRAEATGLLRVFSTSLDAKEVYDAATNAHRVALAEDIKRFMNRPDATFKRVTPLPTPPGDPIGSR